MVRAVRSTAGESIEVYHEALGRLEGDDRVASLLSYHVGLTVRAGVERIPVLTFDQVRGDIPDDVTLSGRLPPRTSATSCSGRRRSSPSARTSATACSCGSTAARRPIESSGRRCSQKVTSRTTRVRRCQVAAAERLLDGVSAEDASSIHLIDFDWAPGVNAARADHQLEKAGFSLFNGDDASRVVPGRVTNLGEVEQRSSVSRRLPRCARARHARSHVGHERASRARRPRRSAPSGCRDAGAR